MSLITELRRRQVFRAAAWYAAAAWVLIQVASTVFPQFGLPDWSVRAVIVASVLGLPVALTLAWWFDLSRLGVRRETPTAEAVSSSTANLAAAARTAPLWRIPSFWIALALGAGLSFSAQQAWQRLVLPAYGERPGLAVLPFANLSPDPANAYFADGLHEEILATFARAGGLRVISRTSVQEYRDSRRNLREIAEALDATLILEGSVRREGDDLRLTLQLIDGNTDEHLWAETYDRKFKDALQLQRTVAEQVVAAIGATLTPTEQRLIAAASPANPEAYEFYLHALTRWNQYAPEAEQHVLLGFLDRTIEFDPEFALAYALRAKVRVWLISTYIDDVDGTVAAAARSDIERALALEPELPEALAARGLYATYVDRDPGRGLADLERAIGLAPNDPDTRNVAGLTLRRLGRFDEAIAQFRASARLAPTDPRYAYRAHETLVHLGRFEEARQESRVLLRRFPELPYSYMHPYLYECLRTGKAAAGWREELERRRSLFQPGALSYFTQSLLYCEGDMAGLAAYLLRVPEEILDVSNRDYELGIAFSALGDAARAQPHLAAVAAKMPASPDDAWIQAMGAVALELLGRRAEALGAADRAVQLSAASYDAVNGPSIKMLRTWVLIRSGTRSEEGYAEFARLLGSYLLQPGSVAIDPLWRLMREDERTQKILRTAIAGQAPMSDSADSGSPAAAQ